jgi:hypothetical protein
MCRVDDAERCTQLQLCERKARKEHRCSECYRTIAKGERYRYEVTVYDGFTSTIKTCKHCWVAREWLTENCGGFIYKQVLEEIREHAEEYPRLALPLYRICTAAGRKWQRFDNSGLMSVPKLPPSIEGTLAA